MKEADLLKLANEVAKGRDFKLGECISKGEYYSPENIRSMVFEGTYDGSPAVLKVYDDPRLTDEGPALENFNKNFFRWNQSKLLQTPKLFAYKVITPKSGWLIMEKLPEGGNFLQSPIKEESRYRFLTVFLQYWSYAPKESHRPLSLAENLSSAEYHCFRISRWMELANQREAELMTLADKLPILEPEEFIPRYKKAMTLIREGFNFRSFRKMVWCAHGHFKPSQIYCLPISGRYYLTDFAHAKMYPPGYELALIIWADWLMAVDWRMDYSEWSRGLFRWIDAIDARAKDLEYGEALHELILFSLLERILGTILADVVATANRSREEKEARINLLYQAIDVIIKELRSE